MGDRIISNKIVVKVIFFFCIYILLDALFNTTNCVVCHLADGGGSIGPNFTDENWILGGGIKNVFNTVSEGGREGKGMIPWKSVLSPSEIQQVSSYILSFQGTTPANPKAPEGDVWVE